MSDLQYPTWADVGVPESIVNFIFTMKPGSGFDYLLLNKVFRFPVKAQYLYTCGKCKFTKKMYRIYEDYSKCESCGSHLISSSANWRMGKDKIVPITSIHDTNPESHVSSVIVKMGLAYTIYFNRKLPDNFFSGHWEFDQTKYPLSKKYKKDEDIYNKPPSVPQPLYTAQFMGGMKVQNLVMSTAVFRAAILCPYLWDNLFDWNLRKRKEIGQETHIFPLFNLLARLSTERSGRDSSAMLKRPASLKIKPMLEMPLPVANKVSPKINKTLEEASTVLDRFANEWHTWTIG